MDTLESTDVIKQKQTENLYCKKKNNQIQFRKIIKANAFGKRLLSMRERSANNISVVVSHELDMFSIRYGNFELFRWKLPLINQRAKNPKLCLGVFHCKNTTASYRRIQGSTIER